MATLARQLGFVTAVNGEVFARNADGQMRRVAVGGEVFVGDVIVTANGSSAVIRLNSGAPDLQVAEQQTVFMDEQVSALASEPGDGGLTAQESGVAAKVIQAQGTLTAEEFEALLEEEAAAAGGEASEAGSTFVDLVRIVEVVPGASYSFPLNSGGTAPTVEGEALPELVVNTVPTVPGAPEEPDEPDHPSPPTAYDNVITATLTQVSVPGSTLELALQGALEKATGQTEIWEVAADRWGYKGDLTHVVSDGALQLVDTGSGQPQDRGVASASFVATASGEVSFAATLGNVLPGVHGEFSVDAANASALDAFTYRLFKQVGSAWEEVTGKAATIAGNLVGAHDVVIDGLDAGATYRLVFQVNDQSGADEKFAVRIDNIVTHSDGWQYVEGTIISGNVIDDPSPAGAVDDRAGEAAWVSAVSFGGNDYDVPETGFLTLTGDHGTLVIDASGEYHYSPNPSAEHLGESDVFAYTLTQADGESDTAQLVVNIASTLSDAREVVDSDGSHTLTGTGADDTLLGLAGDDALIGDDGHDLLDGGTGNDSLSGGAGNDILIGGPGDDLLVGGDGADTYVFRAGGESGSTDTVQGFQPGNDVLQFEDVLSVSVSYDAGSHSTTLAANFLDGSVQTVLLEAVDLSHLGANLIAASDNLIKITG